MTSFVHLINIKIKYWRIQVWANHAAAPVDQNQGVDVADPKLRTTQMKIFHNRH